MYTSVTIIARWNAISPKWRDGKHDGLKLSKKNIYSVKNLNVSGAFLGRFQVII